MSGVKMKLLVLLLFGWICCEAGAQQQTYLVVAPLSFRLDALEKVVLQVFGFSDPVTVHVSLNKTVDHSHIIQQHVTLSATNQHMGEVQLRLLASDVDEEMDHVILHIQSYAFQHHMSVPLNRTNSFLVVQTNSPLSTARQKGDSSLNFVQSPYNLGLISTPPFFKPGLPYNIQVLVRALHGEPVSGMPVRLVDRQLRRCGRDTEELHCSPDTSSTNPEGIAFFVCNIKIETRTIDLRIVTQHPLLPADSQASLPLRAESYDSPNGRYLLIDPKPITTAVGAYTRVTVFSVAPHDLSVKSLNYLIMSKGKVVKFGWMPFNKELGNRHMLSFQVTAEMVPCIRLLVYYMPYGESTAELVADAVWLNIRGEFVSGLQVLRHLESADQGCGGGGGKNATDVFRLAGLNLMTNANSGQSSSSEPCTALVQPTQSTTEKQKNQILDQYPNDILKKCCARGMEFRPTLQTCAEHAAHTLHKYPRCRDAFRDCCLHIQKTINQEYIIGH